MVKHTQLRGLEKLYIVLLLVVFGVIVLHAPLSVGLSTLFPETSLYIKAWKELLLGLAVGLAVYVVVRRRLLPQLNQPLFWAIAGFGLVNLALIPVFYTGFEATLAALLINLRFFLFFVLVYIAVIAFPRCRRWFIGTFFAGAVVVIGFAFLQVTVLPYDILTYLGYGPQTIMPYLTVDQNMDYLRITSTLRGPNPLGAYITIMLAAVAALWVYRVKLPRPWLRWAFVALSVAALVALWATYARAAALALGIVLVTTLLVVYGTKITKTVWLGAALGATLLVGAVVAFYDTPFVSQVILHEDPSEGNDVNSNDGHVESFVEGVSRMVRQPLGGGIGSTGSPSLLTDQPLIIENQYFYVAHEVGWLGLALFVYISGVVLVRVWRQRRDWLSLAVFTSGLGLLAIGLVLPVWADDTVALIWWGLAAVALARGVKKASPKPVS